MFKGGRKGLGFFGEGIAERYLKTHGYKILEKNFRTPFGEVDIIAKDGEAIVFIEVKTRKNLTFGLPQESIDENKKRRLVNIGIYYLKKKGILNIPARFDVVSILLSSREERVELIKNAFDLTSP